MVSPTMKCYRASFAVLTSDSVSFTAAQAPSWCSTSSNKGSDNDSSQSSRDLKVMAMGASIVYGQESTDGNGFRLAFQNLLQENGTVQATMIGTQHSGNMSENHHEAYTNVMIGQLGEKAVNSSAYDLSPDIILLMVGTNDCWYMANEDHPDDPNVDDPRVEDGILTAGRFGSLLSSIKSHAPDSLVLASELPFNTNAWQDRCIRGFNQQLPAVVANATEQGQSVRSVSVYDAVPEGEMREDGTHPTDEGYRLMGARWAEAVERAVDELCGNTTESGTETSSAAAGETSQASESGCAGFVVENPMLWVCAFAAMVMWVM